MTHKCDVCHAVFAGGYNLIEHLITHIGEKPYKCIVCHATYIFKDKLETHLGSHIESRPYTAPRYVCSVEFSIAAI